MVSSMNITIDNQNRTTTALNQLSFYGAIIITKFPPLPSSPLSRIPHIYI